MEILPIILGILLGLLVVSILFYVYMKNKDNNKERLSKKVTVLEKSAQQGNVIWYVMECENGSRIRLVSYQANNMIIAVGDKGIVNYKGQTIESFDRK